MLRALVGLLSAAAMAMGAGAVERVERGNLVLEDIPPVPVELIDRLAPYLAYRQATFFDWAPGGGMLISTRFGDVEQLHFVERPLGARQQLTFYDEPIPYASFAPRAARQGFAFLKDADGDENYQIYYYPFPIGPFAKGAAAGAVRRLTDGKSLNGSIAWSNDGTHLAFYSNQRDGVSYDVYVVDPQSQAPPHMVVEWQDSAWYPLDWSPDDSQLLLWDYASITDSSVYVADLKSGVRRLIDPPRKGEHVGTRGAKFSKDGRGVYLVSDRGSEFKQLRYVDLQTGQAQVISGHIPWDIEAFDLSADGRFLAYVSNEDGWSRLNLLDLHNRQDLSGPPLPAGTILNLKFAPTGPRLAFSLETPRTVRDVFAYDLESGRLEQWTRSEIGPVDSSAFVDAELVRYPTFDARTVARVRMPGPNPADGPRREIPAFVFKPPGTGPFPVLISIHGGPESQYRPGYEPFTQFLAKELGYAVIAPNVRGSDGYGKTYLSLDNGFRREDAVLDIGKLLEWIARQPYLDARRVVVMGGSYGGYMSLASLAQFGERLRGGIDVVGITHYVTFLTNTSGYRRDLRRAEYGDEREPAMRKFLERISPLNNAARIKQPLLVVQGMNDARVPASESEQLVVRIRGNGGGVWYLAARDEGHSFRKKQNRDAYLQTVALFLQNLARPEPAG